MLSVVPPSIPLQGAHCDLAGEKIKREIRTKTSSLRVFMVSQYWRLKYTEFFMSLLIPYRE
jgi:hypothetical protein